MLKVTKQSTPKRCEICHQADLFDAETESCLRCAQVVPLHDNATIDNSSTDEPARSYEAIPVDYQLDNSTLLWRGIKGGFQSGLSSGLVFGSFALLIDAAINSRTDLGSIMVLIVCALLFGVCASFLGVVVAIVVGINNLIFKPANQMFIGGILGDIVGICLGLLIFNQALPMHTSDKDFWADFAFCIVQPAIIGIIAGSWTGIILHRARPNRQR